MQRLKLIAGPECEPVTLDEVKAQRARTDSLDDAYLESCIAAMRQHAEAETGRQMVTAVYELTVEAWNPAAAIELPRPPLQSVESITAVADDGTEAVVDPSAYEVVADTIVGFVRPAPEQVWPEARTLVIRFSAGYPTVGSPATATTPEPIKQWMLVRIGTMDEYREAVVSGTIVGKLPRDFVDALLDPYRIPWVV